MPQLSNLLAQAFVAQLAVELDGGGSNGVLELWDDNGVGIPADGDAATIGRVKLSELTLNSTSFGSPSDDNPGARVSINLSPAVTQDTHLATGTCTFARLRNSSNTRRVQLKNVATSPGIGVELVINNVNVQPSSVITVVSLDFVQPES